MGSVTTALRQEAESIFSDLGYAVTAQGSGIRAERKWRVVDVTPVSEPQQLPASSGEYRCFVTWEEDVTDLERHLQTERPDYEWAIIGISEDEDYVVSRRD